MAKSFDDKLLENGIVWVHSGLDNEDNDYLGQLILSLMSFKNQPEQLVQVFITSTNYNYTSYMVVYDILQSLPNPVATFGIGMVDYYGTLLLAAGKKGKRYALRNTKIGLSQPIGYFTGTTLQTDAVVEADEVGENRAVFEEILARCTGKPLEKIHADCSKNLSLSAEEAKEYGIIDHILG